MRMHLHYIIICLGPLMLGAVDEAGSRRRTIFALSNDGEMSSTTHFTRVGPERSELRSKGGGSPGPRRQRAAWNSDQQSLRSVWERIAWRQEYFNLTVAAGEHPCFAGFASMMRDTTRCAWQRAYPAVGGTVELATALNPEPHEFTLAAVVGGYINIWMEGYSPDLVESCSDNMVGLAGALASRYRLDVGDSIKCTAAFDKLSDANIDPAEYCKVIASFCCSCGSIGKTAARHLEVATKAAEILMNLPGLDVLRPPGGQASWIERMCTVLGPLPFMYTCSNRIGVLVQTCFESNARVRTSSLFLCAFVFGRHLQFRSKLNSNRLVDSQPAVHPGPHRPACSDTGLAGGTLAIHVQPPRPR